MTQSGSYTLITLAPLLVILIGLGITVTIDPNINRGQRGVLLLIVVLTFRVVLKDGMRVRDCRQEGDAPWQKATISTRRRRDRPAASAYTGPASGSGQSPWRFSSCVWERRSTGGPCAARPDKPTITRWPGHF